MADGTSHYAVRAGMMGAIRRSALPEPQEGSTAMCWQNHQRRRDWAGWERRPGRVSDEAPIPTAPPPPSAAAPQDRVPERDPDVRVSQAERDEVAAALAQHYADGRLTLGEYEERVAAAMAATTGRDFEPLFVDLPTDPPVPAPAPVAAGPASAPAPGPASERWSGRLAQLPLGVVLPVLGVLVLVVLSGPWALWLLWPALAMSHGSRRHHHGHGHHGRHGHRARTPWDDVGDREPVRVL